MSKYNENLVKEFISELEKVPMIRQACSKIGIDHSTVYRWMIKHPDFFSKVQIALTIGRKNVTDAAESVILNGIQNKEFRSAAFWLQHNEYRYMKPKQGEYYDNLTYTTLKRVEKIYEEDDRPRFDKLFKLYDKIEREYPDEPEAVKYWVNPYIDIFCEHDPKLIEVFHRAYQEWKKDKELFENSARKTGMEFDNDGNPIEPSEDS